MFTTIETKANKNLIREPIRVTILISRSPQVSELGMKQQQFLFCTRCPWAYFRRKYIFTMKRKADEEIRIADKSQTNAIIFPDAKDAFPDRALNSGNIDSCSGFDCH